MAELTTISDTVQQTGLAWGIQFACRQANGRVCPSSVHMTTDDESSDKKKRKRSAKTDKTSNKRPGFTTDHKTAERRFQVVTQLLAWVPFYSGNPETPWCVCAPQPGCEWEGYKFVPMRSGVQLNLKAVLQLARTAILHPDTTVEVPLSRGKVAKFFLDEALALVPWFLQLRRFGNEFRPGGLFDSIGKSHAATLLARIPEERLQALGFEDATPLTWIEGVDHILALDMLPKAFETPASMLSRLLSTHHSTTGIHVSTLHGIGASAKWEILFAYKHGAETSWKMPFSLAPVYDVWGENPDDISAWEMRCAALEHLQPGGTTRGPYYVWGSVDLRTSEDTANIASVLGSFVRDFDPEATDYALILHVSKSNDTEQFMRIRSFVDGNHVVFHHLVPFDAPGRIVPKMEPLNDHIESIIDTSIPDLIEYCSAMRLHSRIEGDLSVEENVRIPLTRSALQSIGYNVL